MGLGKTLVGIGGTLFLGTVLAANLLSNCPSVNRRATSIVLSTLGETVQDTKSVEYRIEEKKRGQRKLEAIFDYVRENPTPSIITESEARSLKDFKIMPEDESELQKYSKTFPYFIHGLPREAEFFIMGAHLENGHFKEISKNISYTDAVCQEHVGLTAGSDKALYGAIEFPSLVDQIHTNIYALPCYGNKVLASNLEELYSFVKTSGHHAHVKPMLKEEYQETFIYSNEESCFDRIFLDVSITEPFLSGEDVYKVEFVYNREPIATFFTDSMGDVKEDIKVADALPCKMDVTLPDIVEYVLDDIKLSQTIQ